MSVRQRLKAFWGVIVASAIVLFGVVPTANAVVVDSMSIAYQDQVHGDYISVGNGVLEAGSNVYGAWWLDSYRALFHGGSSETYANNGYFYMQNVDVDSNPNTYNSSSAKLTIPAGATPVYAQLYWSANLGSMEGSRVQSCASSTNDSRFIAQVPSGNPASSAVIASIGSNSVSVTPQTYNDDVGQVANGQPNYYAASASVLSLLQSATAGQEITLTVGNVWSAEGAGCYGGWGINVVYDYGAYVPGNDSSTLHAVTIYEGYDRLFSGEDDKISLSGLMVQGGQSHFTALAWEGDRTISGDRAVYSDDTTSSYSLPSPGSGSTNNYFEGYSEGAVPYTTYNGSKFYNGSVSMAETPLDQLTTGDTAIDLTLESTGDSYLFQAAAVSVPLAEVSIFKTAANGETDQAILPGDTPSFRVTIYNSGGVNLLQMHTDDASTPSCTKSEAEIQALINAQYPATGEIPPGGSIQYTCSGSPTSTSFDNQASVSGYTPDNMEVKNSGISKVLVSTWEMTKEPKTVDVPSGTTATWVINVKNTGDADIYDVSVSDPSTPDCARTIGVITAGSTWSYECTSPNPISTTTSNTATATGQARADKSATISPTMPTISDSATVYVSDVQLTKTVDDANPSVGDNVTFSFDVTNTGTATLNSYTLTDPQFPQCDQTINQPLAPGASRTLTCTVTPFTAATTSTLTNTAKVVATPPSGLTVSDSASVDVDDADLSIVKNATGTAGEYTDVNGNGSLDSPDTITYSFTVTNTGSATLTNVGVTDDMLTGPITCDATTLAAGASTTCTASDYTVTLADVNAGQVANTATASGTDPDGDVITATASKTLTTVQRPSISLNKTAASADGDATVDNAGEAVTYTFAIENDGNVTMNSVDLTDPMTGLSNFSAITCTNTAGNTVSLPASLDPGEVLTCSATLDVSQAQFDDKSKQLTNTANVTATSPQGVTKTATATATITMDQQPGITVTKTADKTSFSTVGEEIQYTVAMTNTGNVTASGSVTDTLTGLTNLVCRDDAGNTVNQPSQLAPAASVTCTSTMTVTQAMLDSGSINNTATGELTSAAGDKVTGSASYTISPATNAHITLTKTADQTQVSAAGQTITYTVTAANDGNTTLNNVDIAESMADAVAVGSCNPTTLAPGAKQTCTFTYSVKQADMDAGTITNTASVTATDSHGTAVSDTDSVDVTATAAPALSLRKSATPSTISATTDQVTYTFLISNTGNVTLNGLSLNDGLTGLSTPSCTPALSASLAPGATATCTATYQPTQADLDAGSINNTATVSATAPAGTSVTSDPSTAKVDVDQNPDFTATKSASPTVVAAAGSSVNYTITVTNTGNVTLTNLAVTDPKLTGLSCASTAIGASLAPGASTTCTGTHTVTQAEFDAGSLTNTANVTLTFNGTDTTKKPSAVVDMNQTSSMAVTKTSPDTTYAAAGDTINYTITASNTGTTTLTDVSVTDPLFPATNPLRCTPAIPAASLAPGAQITCTGTYTVTQADVDAGQVDNTATATGTDPKGTSLTSAGSFTSYAVQNPDFTLTKTANPTTVSNANESVAYSIVLENTGNVTLDNAQITDNRLTGGFTSCSPALGSSLAPGKTLTCTGTYTTTQADIDSGSILNTATGNAADSDGNPVGPKTASATVSVVANPQLTLTKSAAPSQVSTVGEVVTYTFTVKNTGNRTARAVTITDPIDGLSAITCSTTTLAPGESTKCTATRAVTQADLNSATATITNTATVNAIQTDGTAFPSASSTAQVSVNQNPQLTLAKSADQTSGLTLGDTVTYTLVATNSGNVNVDNVQVADPDASALNCTPALGSTLAPGATLTCTGTRAITQDDVDAGSFTNTATADGTDPQGNAVTQAQADATVTTDQQPDSTFVKTAALANGAAKADTVGDIINYTLTFTNTGNTTLKNVKIADGLTGLSTLTCSPALGSTLAPGAVMTCNATYAVTQADLGAGSIVNSATANSTDSNNTPRTAQNSSTTTEVAENPDITLTKTSSTQNYSRVGQTVTYTLSATNTGNVTLRNVQVNDDTLDATTLSCTPTLGSDVAPGKTMRCTGTYTVTQADLDAGSIVNTANTSASSPAGTAVTATASRTITAVLDPDISLTKTASPTTVSAVGDVVNYTFVITNKGNVSLSSVDLSETMPVSGLSCPATTIAPSDSITCTATYTVTQADLDAGTIQNQATATGTDSAGTTVNSNATATVSVAQDPQLSLTKTADVTSVSTAGDPINYIFTVTNTGNVTVDDVALTDSMLGLSAVSCGSTTLAPGATTTCSHAYTVTQDDIDSGQINNQATADATTASGVAVPEASASNTVAAVQNPDWTFSKSVDQTDVDHIGDTRTYTLTATNTGNVTINNVVITDEKTKPIYGCTVTTADGTNAAVSLPTSILPGATLTCYGDHTFVQNEFEVVDPDPTTNGIDWDNTATVTGKAADGTDMPTLTDSQTVYLHASPDFAMTKTASVQSYSFLGQQITYTVIAENSGNVALTNVQIIDQMLNNVSMSCSPAMGSTLQPGEKMTCLGSYAVTQADINAGSINNSAYGTGTDPQGVDHDATAPGSLTVEYVGVTGMALSKSASPAAVDYAGQNVTYSFLVKNLSAGADLENVAITDPMLDNAGVTINCPSTTVPVDTEMTCTATYTVTQADIDNGRVLNTATATSTAAGDNLTSSSSATVVASHSSGVTIVKSAQIADGGSAVDSTNDTVNYSFLVTNTGNVKLTDVTVTDPLRGLSNVTCPQTELAPQTATSPGESMTCTATLDVDQTHLNGSEIANTASVSATDIDGNVKTDSSDATVPTAWNPDLSITKTPSQTTVTSAGTNLTYAITLENTGNVTLSNVKPADTDLPGLSALSCTPAVGSALAPGATMNCNATYRVKQSDIDAGSINNTVTTTTSLPDGSDGPNPSASAVVSAPQTPSLTTTKTVSESTFDSVGDTLHYNISVQNSGNVTLHLLSVTDSLNVSNLNCSPALGSDLAPGATMNCTASYAVTQADLDAGAVQNVATGSGTDPQGNLISDPSDSAISTAVQNTSLDLEKTANPTTVSSVGTVINYTFKVRNTGNVTVNQLTVTDPLAGLSAISCPQTSLAPDAEMDCTASYTVTQVDLNNARPDSGVGIHNEATVSGTTDTAGNPADATASNDVYVDSDPALSLDKTVSEPTYSAAGQTRTYTFTITNTGNVNVDNLALTDPMSELGAITCTPALSGLSLAPGDVVTCSATATLTQANVDAGSLTNQATVTGTGPDGVRTAQDTSTVTINAVQNPALSITKTSQESTVNALNDPVHYTITAVNSGNVTISNADLTDTFNNYESDYACTLTVAATGATSTVTGNVTDLAPGDQIVCTGTRLTTQTDLDAGSLLNTATITGTDPQGGTVNDTASNTVDAVQSPAISLVKNITSVRPEHAGDSLDYEFTIENIGTVTLSDIDLDDPLIDDAAITCTPSLSNLKLAPGESIYCSATIKATQAQMDSVSIDNTATVTANTPSASTPTVSAQSSTSIIPVHYPKLTLDKSHDISAVTAAGDVVTYTFTVTNTGNSRVENIAVTDPMSGLSAITCGATALDVNASTTCTATYTATQADVNAGAINNTATVTGTDPYAGDPVEKGTDTDTVPVVLNPELTVTKTAQDPTTGRDLGDVVTFDVVVENTGNVTLTDVTPVDTGADVTSFNCGAATTLAPGASVNCTATVNVLQKHIDAGSVTNTAAASAKDPTGADVEADPASAQVPTVDKTASIDLQKVAAETSVNADGDVINYTFTATNTGGYTLDNVVLTDPLSGLSPLNCSPAQGSSLAPGKVMTCTASYAAGQNDIDAGQVDNTATVNATDVRNNTAVTDTASVSVPAAQNPSLAIKKTADRSSVSNFGDVITYTFTVTNDGNVSVDSINIDDTLANAGRLDAYSCTDAAGNAVTLGSASLAPQAKLTCTAAHTVQQDEMDAGSVNNTAFATGTTPLGANVDSTPQSVTVTANQTPGIDVDKTADTTLVQTIGTNITYTITARNTGNVTLRNAEITDANATIGACQVIATDGTQTTTSMPAVLAPGEVLSCTASYTSTHTDLENGSISNTAQFTSTDPNNNPVDGKDTNIITVLYNPELTFDKDVVAPTNWVAGDELDYWFEIKNTGNMDAWYATVTDTMFSPAELTCRDVTSTSYTLADIEADNSLYTSGSFVDATALATQPLAAGSTRYCTATHIATQQEVDQGYVSNTAKTSAYETSDTDAAGNPTGFAYPVLTDMATTTTVHTPSMSLVKTAAESDYDNVDDVIHYTFQVTNTGELTISNLSIDDDLAGVQNLACDTTSISPGQLATCTGTYRIKQADMDRGSLTNTAKALGADPSNQSVETNSDSVTLTALTDPAITLDKTAQTTSVNQAGETVQFTLTATNTGDVTIDGVQIAEELSGATITSCDQPQPLSLAPTKSLTCMATYTVTQGDMDHASFTNTARVTGTAADGTAMNQTAAATVSALQSPGVKLEKTSDKSTVDTLGETITYSFTVTNTGNVSLYDTTVTDPLDGLSALTCDAGSPADANLPGALLPGAVMNCTATYAVTQADLDDGNIDNTATVNAHTLADPATAITARNSNHVDAISHPALGLTKTSDYSDAGTRVTSRSDVITYTFVVENTGNTTIHDWVISDDFTASGMVLSCPTEQAPYDENGDGVVDANDTWHPALAPGETATCTGTYSPSQGQMDAGSFTNTATVSGLDPHGTPAVKGEDSDTVQVDQEPQIEINKDVDTDQMTHVNQEILYTYVGKNTGNVSLDLVSITDNMLDGIGEDLLYIPDTMQYDANGDYIPGTGTLGVECYPTLPATLEPNDSIVCRAELRVTQQMLNGESEYSTGAGLELENHVDITGTAPDGTVVTDSDDQTVATVPDPEIAITKQARTDSDAGISDTVTKAGDTITYTINARNLSNFAVTTAAVHDSILAQYPDDQVTCSANANTTKLAAGKMEADRLDPNQGMICTIEHTVTQEEIDNGGLYLYTDDPDAEADSDIADDPTTAKDETHQVPVAADYANSTAVTITNNVQMSAEPIQEVGDHNGDGRDDAKPLPAYDHATVLVQPTASYSMSKSVQVKGSGAAPAPQVQVDKAGEVVTYYIQMTNTGSVTLQDITISDDTMREITMGTLSCSATNGTTTLDAAALDPDNDGDFQLAPGYTLTCTADHTMTQAEIDQAQTPNVATITANVPAAYRGATDSTNDDLVQIVRTDADGNVILDADGNPMLGYTQSDDALVLTHWQPAMRLEKTADRESFSSVGQVINYTINYTNTGNVTSIPAITDDLPGVSALECTTDATSGATQFTPGVDQPVLPGQSITCTTSYTVTQDDIDAGSVNNPASAVAALPNGGTITGAAAAVVPAVQTPSASMDKQVALTHDADHDGKADVDDTLTYTITVSNRGNASLTNARVVDPMLSHLSCSPELPGTIAPGQTAICTGTYTVDKADATGQELVNTAQFISNETDPMSASARIDTDSPVPTIARLAHTGAQAGLLLLVALFLIGGGFLLLLGKRLRDDEEETTVDSNSEEENK